MSESDRQTDVLEAGDIFFFYRPRVEEESPAGLRDVQRFGMVLRPRSGEKVRQMVVGQKRLPAAERHERYWGFVEAVASSARDIEKNLRGEVYETKTRGERTEPAARPAGRVSMSSLSRTARCICPMRSNFPSDRERCKRRSGSPLKQAMCSR
ncbi:hypothetical protein PPNSA23_27140 [Phyllobacterium phragmitis]|uniref:EVE domain-containing protein n=1 Tax=Phyllobacterium phragmitis TaxID=2670329 RepID=A0ABQ0H1F9_9HYPH